MQGAGGIGGLLARTDNTAGTSACYFADGNGNITCMMDGTQTVVAKYLYDPFGRILGQSGWLSDANLYRFSSKELHVNSGLIYYLYRFYDPSLQRWINRDPIGEPGFEANRGAFSEEVNDATLALAGLKGPAVAFSRQARSGKGVDSWLDNRNLYDFLLNDPVNQVDALGLLCFGWVPPFPPKWNVPPGPPCNAYGGNSTLKFICNHAGTGCWANCVRGCLLANWNAGTGKYNSGIVQSHASCWHYCDSACNGSVVVAGGSGRPPRPSAPY